MRPPRITPSENLEYVLRWSDDQSCFEERHLHPASDIGGLAPGERVVDRLGENQSARVASCELAPGEIVPGHSPDKIVHLLLEAFASRRLSARIVLPRVGRFYPLAMLPGLRASPPDSPPLFRILDILDDRMTIDLNHPLAGRSLSLEVRPLSLEKGAWPFGSRGWLERLCSDGPGMQSARPGLPTDFFDPDFFARPDHDDGAFYAAPRFTSHLDRRARSNLQGIYERFLQPGMRVLDLMSSVDSHLPNTKNLHVTGLGLNQEELARNPLLSDRLDHDLNRNPALPMSCGSFEAAVCSLSIEYLIRPVEVLESVRRHLVPGGPLLVGFSNRWFPTKAISGWLDLHEFERMGLVLELFRRAGFQGPSGTVSIRNHPRPADDPHFRDARGLSDPVYVVWTHA